MDDSRQYFCGGFLEIPIFRTEYGDVLKTEIVNRDPFDRMLAAQAKLEKPFIGYCEQALTWISIIFFVKKIIVPMDECAGYWCTPWMSGVCGSFKLLTFTPHPTLTFSV